MTATTTPDRIYFTDDDDANRLLASDPMALLIGMVLDQQVTVQKAFSGPLELKKRVGTLDAATIAGMDASRLEAAFRERPAIHRFPGNMARRTQDLCAAIAAHYDNDPRRIWTEAKDARDLEQRLLTLPRNRGDEGRQPASPSWFAGSGSRPRAGTRSRRSSRPSATLTRPRRWRRTAQERRPTRPSFARSRHASIVAGTACNLPGTGPAGSRFPSDAAPGAR